MMYVDPDGELAWFIPILIGAAIGAGTNVATNWDAITQNGFNFGKFLSYAGVGAVSGGVGAISGPFAPLAWAASGAISGAGNAAISGGNVFQGLWMGATTGLVGGKIGQSIAPHIGKVLNHVTVNGTSLSSIPVLNGAIGGGLGGAAVGGAIGFGVGYAQTKTLDGALKGAGEGALSGLKTGAIAGAASASATALAKWENPFTGNPIGSKVDGLSMVEHQRVKASMDYRNKLIDASEASKSVFEGGAAIETRKDGNVKISFENMGNGKYKVRVTHFDAIGNIKGIYNTINTPVKLNLPNLPSYQIDKGQPFNNHYLNGLYK